MRDETEVLTDRAWALLFVRLVLGVDFLMAGIWKVFMLGPLEHVKRYFLPAADSFLPVWSLWLVGASIPFVELLTGAMVLVGFRARAALIALGFVLAIVAFGHLLLQPLFSFSTHLFPRLAWLAFLLALPRDDDHMSIDWLLKQHGSMDSRLSGK
jgi:uncharacterized membrane protein YphA (DoxX/SURF4 family)